MDLKTMRDELQKLTTIVEGWEASEYIAALERDLALEKLRTLYDAVRFAEVETSTESPAAQDESATVDPVAIDLGAVLSLDPLSELESDAEEESVTEVSVEPIAVQEIPAEPVLAAAKKEEEPAMPELEEQSQEVHLEESATIVSDSQGFNVAVPETVVNTETVAEQEQPSESVSEPVPVAATKPQYVAPTLFGLEEEETVRHRHKQRVIMSLYDTPSSDTPDQSVAPAKDIQQPALTERPVVAPKPAEPTEQPVVESAELKSTSVLEEEVFVEISQTQQEEVDDEEANFEEITITPSSTGAVLGDVINHDVQTLADTLAPPRDRASELRRSEPVADLRKAIGINDKFLLIRDLFDGDGVAYEKAIETLNACADFDDCMIYIAENYAWNPNSDGAKLLMELLERKFA